MLDHDETLILRCESTNRLGFKVRRRDLGPRETPDSFRPPSRGHPPLSSAGATISHPDLDVLVPKGCDPVPTILGSELPGLLSQLHITQNDGKSALHSPSKPQGEGGRA